MPILDFPDFLPEPLNDITPVKPNKNVDSEFDSGKTRTRGKFTTTNWVVSIQWQFTFEEHSIFYLFLEKSLNEGRDWFNYPLATRGDIETHECKFISEPIQQQVVGHKNFLITARLEVKPVTDSGDLFLDVALSFGSNPSEINTLIDDLNEFLNQY